MKKICSLFFITVFVFSINAVAQENEQAFLAANKKKKGVITTASGLQYEILSKGNGQKPTLSNQVSVHYVGTLTDGTEFDNSYKRGTAPTVFPVGAVIQGWQEGLQLMSIGSKYKFYIPSALAYGKSGTGKFIKPNSILIFVVDLIGIVGVNDLKPEEIKPTSNPAKPAAKPATTIKSETVATTTTNDESAPETFEEQIITILTNPNNNFKNIIGDEFITEAGYKYATDYKTNINIEGVGKGVKITKYPTEKKMVYYAESNGMSKQIATELVDDILKKMKKIKMPYTFTQTEQYKVATRNLITLNFFNENKQPVGMDMDIDAMAGSDKEGAGWQITIRISKKITVYNIYGN